MDGKMVTSRAIFLRAMTMMAAKQAFGRVLKTGPRKRMTMRMSTLAKMPFTWERPPTPSKMTQRERPTQPGKPPKNEDTMLPTPYANSSLKQNNSK